MNKKLVKNGLLTTLGVVSATIPLATAVSCGKAEQQDNRVGSEYDKEYGVDEAVYEKLKSSFVSQATAGLTESEAINVKRSLNKTFNLCDAKMDEMNLSYTAISNGLIEYAARVYPNVKLVRETTKKTVKWDDLTVEFDGMLNSMKAYMDNLGIHGDDQTPFIEEARRVFNGTGDTARYPGIVKTVKAKYHDPLMGLMQAKAQMLQCFESVDEKIGLVGASIRLSQFMENHEIFYNKTTDDSAPNKFDNMKSWLSDCKGKSIAQHIASVFEIKDKTTGETLTTFNPESVCPGYIVKPILKGWTEDPIKNEYKLNIDWTCVCSAHKDSEKADIATAHLYNNGNNVSIGDEFNFDNYIKQLNESTGIEYNVILSKKGEMETLKNTYFDTNKEHIAFDWKQEQVNDNALDAFFFGDRIDDRTTDNRKYSLDTRTLAMTGINIGSKTPDQNDSKLVRLDSLMQTSSADEGKKENTDDELVESFLKNCKLWSNVDINVNTNANAINDVIKASIRAQYSNSAYEFEKEDPTVVVDTRESLSPSWFTITDKSYQYLTEQYNTFSQYTEPYANNMFASCSDDCNTEVTINAVLYAFSALFAIDTTIHCIVPVFAGRIPIYIVLLALTWISMGAQSASLGLLVEYKDKPLKEFKEEDEKLIKKPSVKNFVDHIKNMGDKYYLCHANDDNVIRKGSTEEKDKGTYLYNFKLFKEEFGDIQKFVSDTLPVIDEFQGMGKNKQWKAFTADVNNSKCSPSEFEKTMKEWAAKGVFTITNYVCLGLQLVCDITSMPLLLMCPEMKEWQTVKEARLAAEESGQSTLYVMRTYKTLSEIKKFRAAIAEYGDTAKVTAQNELLVSQVEERFILAVDRETGHVKKIDDFTGMVHFYKQSYNAFPDRLAREFANQFDAWHKTIFINEFEKLAKQGNIGFKSMVQDLFALKMTRGGSIGKEMDELGLGLAKNFVRDFKNAASYPASLRKCANGLSSFQAWMFKASRQVRDLVVECLNSAEKFLKEGEMVNFANEFGKIDDILIEDFKNIEKTVALADAQSYAINIAKSLKTPLLWINDALNTMKKAIAEGSTILFNII